MTSFDACLQDKEKVRAGRVRRLAGWKAERAPNTHRAPPGEPLRVRGVSRGLHPPPSSRTGTRRSPGSSSGAAKLACRAESSASGEVSERRRSRQAHWTGRCARARAPGLETAAEVRGRGGRAGGRAAGASHPRSAGLGGSPGRMAHRGRPVRGRALQRVDALPPGVARPGGAPPGGGGRRRRLHAARSPLPPPRSTFSGALPRLGGAPPQDKDPREPRLKFSETTYFESGSRKKRQRPVVTTVMAMTIFGIRQRLRRQVR